MGLKNIYSGSCLSCNCFVKEKEGFIKLKNAQKGSMIGRKRNEPRKYGVYCKECFMKYAKVMKEKYNHKV